MSVKSHEFRSEIIDEEIRAIGHVCANGCTETCNWDDECIRPLHFVVAQDGRKITYLDCSPHNHG